MRQSQARPPCRSASSLPHRRTTACLLHLTRLRNGCPTGLERSVRRHPPVGGTCAGAAPAFPTGELAPADPSSSASLLCTCGSGEFANPPSGRILRITRSNFCGSSTALTIKKLNRDPFSSRARTSGAGPGAISATTFSCSAPDAIEISDPVRCCTANNTSESVALLALIPNSPLR